MLSWLIDSVHLIDSMCIRQMTIVAFLLLLNPTRHVRDGISKFIHLKSGINSSPTYWDTTFTSSLADDSDLSKSIRLANQGHNY